MVVVAEFAQPFASVKLYVIVCVPTPAVAALKVVPVTPGPENVPPTGVPFNVIDDPLTQTGGYVPALTVGSGLTVIVVVAVFEHAFAFV